MNELKNLNWIEAIKRTWYVIWGFFMLFAVTSLSSSNVIQNIFLGFVLPYIFQKIVQWIYRGLTSKKAS